MILELSEPCEPDCMDRNCKIKKKERNSRTEKSSRKMYACHGSLDCVLNYLLLKYTATS